MVNTPNLIQYILDLFHDLIGKLKKALQSGSIKCEYKVMKLDINDTSTSDFIASLEPFQIDWSNIPDYIHQKDFMLLAQRCSVAETAHTAHFMNWVQLVFGSHLLDFGEKMQ